MLEHVKTILTAAWGWFAVMANALFIHKTRQLIIQFQAAQDARQTNAILSATGSQAIIALRPH